MTLAIKDLSVAYGKAPVLKGVNIQFKAGEFYALIGPNGSGKSTLLKAISGLLPLQNGGITGLNSDAPRAQQIAYMSQERMAHPLMRVEDIVALGREPYRRPFRPLSETDHKFIKSALIRADVSKMKDARYGALSGGQKARVHLARTLTVNAPVLLVDEPVAALDPYYQLSILTALKNEAACGRIVIAALHDLSLVQTFASQVCIMHEGRLVKTGTPTDALTSDLLKDVFRVRMIDGQIGL